MDTETRSPEYRAGHASGTKTAAEFVQCHTGRQVEAAIENAIHADPSQVEYARGYQVGYLDTLMARRSYARNT